jgi:hypothetical protein
MRLLLVSFILIFGGLSKASSIQYSLLDSIPAEEEVFKPIPRKAALYGLIPGGGQIYTRKYWKLPIIYGGLAAGIYAIDFNSRNTKRYKNALFDFQTDRDAAAVGEEYNIPISFISENSLRSQRDKFDKWRQQSYIFTFIGYFITIIEGYVVAHLFDFDISDDLSLRTVPTTTFQLEQGAVVGLGVSARLTIKTNQQKPIKNIFP